ncbi:Chemotaxis signal transduction protein [Hahella chejuensis KCTC 2396]|uniref:Chemotaxis signal transduction protein n=1 Tax=Hahella chejuensis (strain KCTC 2396) TaxID=349521 RepID=Q2SPQ8_HAHCH|nr:chemotaxis protein CheW [Hahella chejuensis]ABC27366.1 Chemotaxis signal transduction protein [Hahella chejuensis KCTC 2396]
MQMQVKQPLEEEQDAEHQAEQENEYLTFSLADEEYAAPIMLVKEIRAWEPVTRVPYAEPWECGLINVRGAIVPIIDLRKRIGLTKLEYNKHTVVVMFAFDSGGRERVRGAVIDALNDVVRFPSSKIQPSPELRKRKATQFAQGVVEYDGRMIVMLDLIRALGMEVEKTA